MGDLTSVWLASAGAALGGAAAGAGAGAEAGVRSGGDGDCQLLGGGGAAQAQTIFAALHFHFRDAAFLEDLQQLFDFLVGHL